MKPKIVVLCGGKGMRLREETGNKPKPLLTIGKQPILWHIMKHYSHYGFNDFILCLGYKGDLIKEYFNREQTGNWNIIFADTGPETNTGGRIKMIENYISENYFFLTYGDGLADVNIRKLEEFFLQKGKTGVITGVRPQSRFGRITIDTDGIVTGFKEKPLLNDHVNGGFCVFSRNIFNFMDANSVLEREVFDQLVSKKELAMYKHEGFWKCMDTYKDYLELNEMCEQGDPPWKVYQDEQNVI